MPTEVLTIGPVNTVTQNVVYAMPARYVRGYTTASAGGFQVSNDVGFGTSNSLAVSNDGSFETPAAFIRNTASTLGVRFVAQ